MPRSGTCARPSASTREMHGHAPTSTTCCAAGRKAPPLLPVWQGPFWPARRIAAPEARAERLSSGGRPGGDRCALAAERPPEVVVGALVVAALGVDRLLECIHGLLAPPLEKQR